MAVLRKVDKQNKFISMFDTRTGFYARTGIIEDGIDTNVDPFMTNFPELLDVGIMGHCIHGKWIMPKSWRRMLSKWKYNPPS